MEEKQHSQLDSPLFNDPSSWRARLYSWAHHNADTKRARIILFWWSFAESSVWPVPVDVILIGMIASGARRWLRLSLFTAGASVFGGIAGYLIGFAFFDLFGVRIIEFYSLHEEFLLVQSHFDNNAFIALFISAFTPIPYKLFTISGGLFGVHIISFVLASILGRTLRFVGVGWIAHRYGEKTLQLAFKYFKTATAIALIIIFTLLVLL